MDVGGSCSGRFIPCKKPLHPLNMTQDGPQSGSPHFGEGKYLLPLLAFEPRIVKPSFCTDQFINFFPGPVTFHKTKFQLMESRITDGNIFTLMNYCQNRMIRVEDKIPRNRKVYERIGHEIRHIRATFPTAPTSHLDVITLIISGKKYKS